jgi:hypothetical protein
VTKTGANFAVFTPFFKERDPLIHFHCGESVVGSPRGLRCLWTRSREGGGSEVDRQIDGEVGGWRRSGGVREQVVDDYFIVVDPLCYFDCGRK